MRLILDTNLWSYIAEADAKAALERLAVDNGVTVCTPPATLLEVFKNQNQSHRDAVIATMTSPLWHRLRTEVDRECEEVVNEAKRVRPHWIRQFPQPDRPASLRSFWTKRIWRAAADNSIPWAELQSDVMGPATSHVYDALKTNSLEARRNAWQGGSLRHVTIEVDEQAPAFMLEGWDDMAPVAPWRFDCRNVFRHELERPRAANTFADWLAPYLELDRVTKDWADFTRFWFNDVVAENMPRNWIRSMTHLALLESKITRTSPGDGQLSTYLVDCDLFLSEDKRLITALQRVRGAADFPIAKAVRVEVPEARDVVALIEREVEQFGRMM